jgi:hypothetical protein
MDIKYTNILHKIPIPTFSIARPYKIYPNWDFWFENKSSGIPENKRESLLDGTSTKIRLEI